MSYLLALDQGTTSSRALVFDAAGELHGLAQREFAQIYPRAGWVEHDPLQLLDSQLETARDALRTAGIEAGRVAAIGITNQRETCLLWERSSGRPCGNALVWQDRRTAEACARLAADGAEALVSERAGLLLDPYFSASKLQWLLDADPDLRRRAGRGELAFGTIDSWLVWHLSEGRRHVTDATNASRTALFDIRRGCWDEDLLALWNIPHEVLPEVVDSSGVCAETTAFGAALPIAGIAGDQQAALFGQACFAPGMAKCTYGTGCFLLMATGREAPRSTHRLLTTIATRIGGETTYALEGSVFMGGATVQWLRDGLGMIDTAAEIEALAATVADSDGVVLVPAFAGLGAPYWDAHARGLLIGMTRGTTRAHVARAALEAIALQVADVATAMAADSGTALAELRVDGGASANDLLMQIQSDILATPLLRPHMVESTAHGAALLAGLGVGLYPDRAAAAAAWRAERRFTPAADAAAIAALRARWGRAVDRARAWDEPPCA
ncbi:MAG: glycerol kinase GlpK [Gammaproteobacteria bacterium]|nr:glycerol kinase GlpK [Gammaproteobacteria bacterium]MCP5201679.1 glycerol kinase GlpK [Gammaproteobacteria bacterium]